jgi:hypothetical protein
LWARFRQPRRQSFSGKLLEFLTQTGSKSLFEWACVADPYLIPQ